MSLINHVACLQASRTNNPCRHSLDSCEVCQQGKAAPLSKVQALAGARQLIVDAVEHLQVTCDDSVHHYSLIDQDYYIITYE